MTGLLTTWSPSMLATPLDQLAYIIEKAREFDAQTAPVDSDSGSNPSDDNNVAILEGSADNPARQELVAALDALDEDQRIEILALMWLGRGDFDRSEWRDALAQAREIHNAAETQYLVGTPLLADYLGEGIAALGYLLPS
jgi:Protein of unknown function (DUF3775)